MKKWALVWATTIFLLCLSAGAQAYTIYDNYYGGNDHGIGDVLGGLSYFDISKMGVTLDGGTMTVDIYSSYFANIGKSGTQLGDLFISVSGWHPYGVSPYLYDNAANGTKWDYAAVIDNHLGTSGHLGLYKIGDGGNIILSNGFSGSTWREGQVVQFAPAGSPISTGAWAIFGLGTPSDSDDYLRLTINSSDLGIGDKFGLHWTMTCANDVIEGEDPLPAPEPATMLLLGSGLISLSFGLRKKFIRQRAEKQNHDREV